jgi:hypothetical protein
MIGPLMSVVDHSYPQRLIDAEEKVNSIERLDETTAMGVSSPSLYCPLVSCLTTRITIVLICFC